MQDHGKAKSLTISHENGTHKIESQHEDGFVHNGDYETAKAAHEAGGTLAGISLKKSGEAGDQQGAASEGDNKHVKGGYEQPDLV